MKDKRRNGMPNHVTNRITFEGQEERILAMLEAVKSDKYGRGSIDFNKLIPRPSELDIEAGSSTDAGLKAYKGFVEVYKLKGKVTKKELLTIPEEKEKIFLDMRKDIRQKDWEIGRAAYRNLLKYGAPTWYEWSIKNWGTKWNAYGYQDGEDYSKAKELRFDTAWAAPYPILKKLSQMYPDIAITHEWADECIGENCGRMKYLSGEITESFLPHSGREAKEFTAKVIEIDLQDYGFVLNEDGTDYVHLPQTEEGMGGITQ